MYFHPRDGYPEVKQYKGFSVGDIVQQKNRFLSTARGHIVRIYQPPYDKHPYIVIEWFGNGAVGAHGAENLELVMTHAQWMAHIKQEREQEERDKERSKKTFRELRKGKRA